MDVHFFKADQAGHIAQEVYKGLQSHTEQQS